MRKFPRFLLWVQKLMTVRISHIKPGNNSLRLTQPAVSQRDRNIIVALGTLATERRKRRHESYMICGKDSDNRTIRDVGQLEPIGSRGQYLAGNLNRLAKGEFGGLIVCIGMRHQRHDCKCKQ